MDKSTEEEDNIDSIDSIDSIDDLISTVNDMCATNMDKSKISVADMMSVANVDEMSVANGMNMYVVNYRNEERKRRMIDRYIFLGLDDGVFRELVFTKEVHIFDQRLQIEGVKKSMDELRIWAIMLQHLDGVRHFIEETKDEYCVVAEDDIHISKKLKEKMPSILKTFKSLSLDVLLLGYLLPFKIDNSNAHFKMIAEHQELSYRMYPSDLWGSQAYLITRRYGEFLLRTFTIEYALTGVVAYNPDWIITKPNSKKRALIYPPLIIEEGENNSNDLLQNDFHRRCHNCYMCNDYV